MPPTALLTAHELGKQFALPAEVVAALTGVDCEVKQGDFVAVVGPSGSGKTTLLNLLSGLDQPTSGSVRFRDADLNQLSERERTALRSQEMGLVFQDAGLMSGLNALDNVRLPQLLSGADAGPKPARELLNQMGLAGKYHRRPSQLSRGEKQRVAIARALVNRPTLLLADEPTGNLDSAATRSIFALLQQLNDTTGLTIVVATHDESVFSFAHHRITLIDGHVVPEGAS